MVDYLAAVNFFYPEDNDLRRTLLRHSSQVRDKALEIMAGSALPLDPETVAAGAMLHDIGICMCHAPDIFCNGDAPYIAHGVIGSGMLREYNPEWETFARICERHTGSGLSAEEIRRQNLSLPARDYLPETLEEKLVCLADKFFSKSGDMQEKSVEQIRRSMAKFGADSLKRFDDLCSLFGV